MLAPLAASLWFAVVPSAEAKIEFRWLEDRPIAGVTLERGLKTSCGEELSYPHKTAILTNADLAWAEAKNHGSVMGVPGDHYLVKFRITEKARKKLLSDSPDGAMRTLGVFVDGKHWSTMPFKPNRPAEFDPFAGYFTSKALVDRIVKPFQ
jgi:hypothetical protein